MPGQLRADPAKARLERRLAAIAFLDVVGYSRLMGADEDTTLRRWAAMRRRVIEPRLRRWHGRVVDRAGDGLFVEFPSALDAVRWAVAVQKSLAPAAAEDPPMQVRVAVHFGDVIDGEHGELYGDGVNIAARLQAHAEPGGIIATHAVIDALPARMAASYFDLGELYLRNIARSIHAFGLRVGEHAARPAPSAIPDRSAAMPSIAVLPFCKEQADRAEAYFAEGIIEGIIHVLTGLDGLLVISRASTLGYAGATIDPRAVGRDLGVRYVLYGSVRRVSDRLRIATELSDAESGALIRADQHEGRLDEIFELQDRISVQVVTTIAPQVRERELTRAMRKHPESLTAYDLVLQALDQLHRLDRESFSRAHGLLQQAIAADPGYAPAYSYGAWWHLFRMTQGWSPDPAADAVEAVRAAQAATERNPNDALALAIKGFVTAYAGHDIETGIQLLDRALAAGPNCALAWAFSSVTCSWFGDGPNAVLRAERGLRLSPFDTFAFVHEHFLALAHYSNGDFEQAILWGRRAAVANPRHAPNLRALMAALVAAGRREEACEYAQRLLAIEPSFSLRSFVRRTPLRGPMRDLYVARLREAGVPD